MTRCARCRTDFCDLCLGFIVNDAPWCEPCGNTEKETGKGRPGLAIVVGLVLFAAWAILILVQLFVIQRFWIASAALVLVPVGAAWTIAYPPTVGEKPRIVDRNATRPRPPLPPRTRF